MSLRRSLRLSTSNGRDQTVDASRDDAPASKSKRKGQSDRPTAAAKRKGDKAMTNSNGHEFAVPNTASAQDNKRRKGPASAAPANPPAVASMPSTVEVIAAPSSSPVTTPKRRKTRPAEPHVTNALLKTPRGSRIAAYPEGQGDTDLTTANGPAGLPQPTTTTDNLLGEACAHLIRVDPSLKPLIEKHPCEMFSPQGLQEEIDPFTSLVSSIMAQQVSGAAAKSIKNKFVALFDVPQTSKNPFPTPAQVAPMDLSVLRTAGLSGRKAEYIKGIAEKFVSGELSARMLATASDDEVLEKLVAVRGLGRWSVEMFECFALKRMDIFSTGDLGVQRGVAAYVGRDVNKLKAKGGKWKYMSEQDMLDVAAKFSPYRTLFMWYMWKISDVNIVAVSGD